MLAPWKTIYGKSRQNITKQIHDFADKGPSSQSCVFSSSNVWMWELDHKESWALNNWYFEMWCWRRLLRAPWIARRSNPSILKEISSEYSLEGLMLKLKLQFFGHLTWRTDFVKHSDVGKDWRQGEKGTTEDEMLGWHHQLDGYEFRQALGIGDGQESFTFCSPWGHKELNMTEQMTWIAVSQHSRRVWGIQWV